MITRRTVLLSAPAVPLLIADRSTAGGDPYDQIRHHAAELRRLLDLTRPDGTSPVELALFKDRYGGCYVATASLEGGLFEFSSDGQGWHQI
jgi:hypothetical protein